MIDRATSHGVPQPRARRNSLLNSSDKERGSPPRLLQDVESPGPHVSLYIITSVCTVTGRIIIMESVGNVLKKGWHPEKEGTTFKSQVVGLTTFKTSKATAADIRDRKGSLRKRIRPIGHIITRPGLSQACKIRQPSGLRRLGLEARPLRRPLRVPASKLRRRHGRHIHQRTLSRIRSPFRSRPPGRTESILPGCQPHISLHRRYGGETLRP